MDRESGGVKHQPRREVVRLEVVKLKEEGGEWAEGVGEGVEVVGENPTLYIL